jgi:2-iminoacetate synthase
VLAGGIGHKRLIAVYGEHPSSDADYIARTLETIYSVRMKTKNGTGSIRRVNVNAAPMTVENLRVLHETGIGTYQVFQETYHHETYRAVHPGNTVKGDYQWRIYCMHRALEAGIDDVGIGALFGLYDWKFEVMGLLLHAIELEKRFGIGPHTISFPRIEPAESTPLSIAQPHRVSDAEFKRAVIVLRLAVPYAGMILTARESASLRDSLVPLGITQMDASSKVGLGAYSDSKQEQQPRRQQFILGDTRSLDKLIHDLADMGNITSFCTAGYRCGRTGKCIMDLLRTGQEGKFCKLNAVITYREWLDDFASDATRIAGEKVIEKEIAEIREKMPRAFEAFMENYSRTRKGERDLFF